MLASPSNWDIFEQMGAKGGVYFFRVPRVRGRGIVLQTQCMRRQGAVLATRSIMEARRDSPLTRTGPPAPAPLMVVVSTALLSSLPAAQRWCRCPRFGRS